ncbi:uncharacterized protein V1513DRAFT_435181 [Lipomyces chichibuensis]|uniref:uncharacterized protein n=1 Tax=Lipomyces chichibuensis TaxID=1546026 RepID=UPI0033437A43
MASLPPGAPGQGTGQPDASSVLDNLERTSGQHHHPSNFSADLDRPTSSGFQPVTLPLRPSSAVNARNTDPFMHVLTSSPAKNENNSAMPLPPLTTPPNPLSPSNVSSLARPVLSPQTATRTTAASTLEPRRNRRRGFSLRTQLFNRQLEQAVQSPIEMIENPSNPAPAYSHVAPEYYGSPNQSAINLAEVSDVDELGDDGQKLYQPYVTQLSEGTLHQSHIRLPNYSSWASSRLFRSGFRGKIDNAYRKTRDFVLRINRLPPSKGGRCVPLDLRRSAAAGLIDERTEKPYVSNTIESAIYNRYNAIPLLLFAQFSKLANVYFLVVSTLQMVPNFSTTGTYNSFITFMFFTAISMAREGFDDWQRHRQDASENNKDAVVAEVDCDLDGEPTVHWRTRPWKDINVGDVVKLSRNDWVPSDLLLLHADGMGDLAYVETAALDGETNLKSKVALQTLADMCGTDELLVSSETRADFVVEDPNTDLYNFEGNVTINGTKYSLSNDNVLYRGSILRNTPSAIGLVIFTGQETKIRLNATQAPRVKAPRLQGRINHIIVFMVLFVIFIAAFCTIMELVWVSENWPWYLPYSNIPLIQLIMSFVIMFNTLIPLSLYVSMEIVKIGQRIMLTWDVDMYHEPTDIPCEAHTSSINEELGQISYVFSDKTGTLTDNVMVFRKISVAGHAWLHDLDVQQEYFREELKKLRQHESKAHDAHGKMPARPSSAIVRTSNVTLESMTSATAHPHGLFRTTSLNSSSVPMPKAFKRAATMEAAFETSSLRHQRSFSSIRTGNSNGPHWHSTAYGPQFVTPAPENSESMHLTRSTVELLQYLQLKPDSLFSVRAKFFLLAMALCHTCIPERTDEINAEAGSVTGDDDVEEEEDDDDDSKINYQASSPDELALVRAARDLGFVVVDRQFKSVTVRTYPNGFDSDATVETYDILETIDFSSARKRMSIVVRFPDGRICLLCKGADTVVFERLHSAKLAQSKKAEVQRRVTLRKNLEASRAIAVRDSMSIERTGSHHHGGTNSGTNSARQSFSVARTSLSRPSLNLRKKETLGHLDDFLKSAQAREAGADVMNTRRPSVDVEIPSSAGPAGRSSFALGEDSVAANSSSNPALAVLESMVDETVPLDTAAVFERTMSHIDEFATEGLRTLVYAHRFMSEDEYKGWMKIYSDAVTSLENRTEKIEAAGELVEINLELTGATAIEDKLQNGVPEAVDKLRRAGIKLWMLTGDKRETAISIGHSCRLIHDFSTVLILRDDDPEMTSKMAAAMLELDEGAVAHCVVVVDGGTLAYIEKDMTIMTLFIELGVKADSVICCRASPSQKALLVSAVRSKVKNAVTLAIGDGANDIAMIQAADVGIGIAGKEGLQASRSSDFSIAQFRFLLKLLLVHGRWNYVRLSKYVLATFYKEFFFYLTQAIYQRLTMYSGTSLYESISLTMYNTLFTSLPVLCLGIFLQDLSPETLIAVPELYSTSRFNKHFNLRIFVGWMFVASSQAVLVTFTMSFVYAIMWPRDNGLYPMGTLNFAAIIVAIATKLNFVEMHNRSYLNFGSITISISGWFLWTFFLTNIYPEKVSLYVVKDTLVETFGPDLTWWGTFFVCCGVPVVFDLILVSVRAGLFPSDTDVFQQIEQDPDLRDRLEKEAQMELANSWANDKRRQKRLQKSAEREAALQKGDEAEEQEILELLLSRNSSVPEQIVVSHWPEIS